jgi:hypothetical protein
MIASLTYRFIVIASAVAAALAGTGILVLRKSSILSKRWIKRGHGVEQKIEKHRQERHWRCA